MRSTQKALVLHTKVYGCLKEMRLFELCTELITFFIKKKKKKEFLPERMAGRQTKVIQTWIFRKHFLEC